MHIAKRMIAGTLAAVLLVSGTPVSAAKIYDVYPSGNNTIPQNGTVRFSMRDYNPADATTDRDSEDTLTKLNQKVENYNSKVGTNMDDRYKAFQNYGGFNGNSSTATTETSDGHSSTKSNLKFEDLVDAVQKYGGDNKDAFMEWLKTFNKDGSGTNQTNQGGMLNQSSILDKNAMEDLVDTLKKSGGIANLGDGSYEDRRNAVLNMGKLFNDLWNAVGEDIANDADRHSQEAKQEMQKQLLEVMQIMNGMSYGDTLCEDYSKRNMTSLGAYTSSKEPYYYKCSTCGQYYSFERSCQCGKKLKRSSNYSKTVKKLVMDNDFDQNTSGYVDMESSDDSIVKTKKDFVPIYYSDDMEFGATLTCSYCGRGVTTKSLTLARKFVFGTDSAKCDTIQMANMRITEKGEWVCDDCYNGRMSSSTYDKSKDGDADYYMSTDGNLSDMVNSATFDDENDPDGIGRAMVDFMKAAEEAMPGILQQLADAMGEVNPGDYEIGTNDALTDAIGNLVDNAQDAAEQVQKDAEEGDPYKRAFEESPDYIAARDKIFNDSGWPADRSLWTDEMNALYDKWKSTWDSSSQDVRDRMTAAANGVSDKITEDMKDKLGIGKDNQTGTELAEGLQKILYEYAQGETNIDDSITQTWMVDAGDSQKVGETVHYEEFRGDGFSIDYNGESGWYSNGYWSGSAVTKTLSRKGNYVIHRNYKKWDMSSQIIKETINYKWIITINGESRELLSDTSEVYSIETSGKNNKNASTSKGADIYVTVTDGDPFDLSVTTGHTTEQIW